MKHTAKSYEDLIKKLREACLDEVLPKILKIAKQELGYFGDVATPTHAKRTILFWWICLTIN